MKVVYLGYYNSEKYNRNSSPAAVTMMDYVAQAVQSFGYDVTIISPAQGSGTSDKIIDNEKVETVYLPSYGVGKNLLGKASRRINKNRDLYEELLDRVDEDTTLIVYHSLAYIGVLKKMRRKRKFRLVLQVNEIYADVTKDYETRKKEIAWLNSADAYLFSTPLLTKEVDCTHKPYSVCLGTYRDEPRLPEVIKEEGQIHLVYAGTFDETKGGGYSAIRCAKYLPSYYHLHICGFGNESQIHNIKEAIKETSSESCCQISYEGCLYGKEYIKMLQMCDIGLSTQIPEAEYNNTSFPSKVLSYMSNGLQVISARIPAIEASPVGRYIHYYDEQTPEKIAEGIQRINLRECKDTRSVIRKLNADFCEHLGKVLVA